MTIRDVLVCYTAYFGHGSLHDNQDWFDITTFQLHWCLCEVC